MFEKVEKISQNINTEFPITQAIVEGTQQGEIFEYKNSAFLIHKAGFSSILLRDDCKQELLELFTIDCIPRYFHIYDTPNELIEIVKSVPLMFNYKLRKRVQLTYVTNQFLSFDIPKDFSLESINQKNISLLSKTGLDLDSRYWANEDEVINKAMGIVLFDCHNEPASICYSAANADFRAEVDVLTMPEYRSQGLAKIAVSAFVNNCIKANLKPNWDCFEDNINSLKVAQSLGFQVQKNYNFMSLYRN